MKIKLYLGVVIACILGSFFAIGLVRTATFTFDWVQKQIQPIYFVRSEPALGGSGPNEDLHSDFGADTNSQNNIYLKLNQNLDFPKVSAKAVLVADLDTKQIIYQKASEATFPIASLSKLMTAVMSLETIDQEKTVIVQQRDVNTYGRQGNLVAGEKILISDLLYPLLLESSNDAAEVLANFNNRNLFLQFMNRKATILEMANTKFNDPSGLSPYNVSTVTDLFKLVQFIAQKRPELLDITLLKKYETDNHTWFNHSHFKNDKNYLGGKNGYIVEAKQTLISVFDLPLEKEATRRIAIILLMSDSSEKDTRNIILYLLKNIYYGEFLDKTEKEE